MRVVTTQGEILVADATQNQDLLWAVRGGGAGQYGVVTGFIKTYPAPATVITASVVLSLVGNDTAAFNASWNALGALASALPGLIDAGVGAGTIQGSAAKGVSISMGFTVFNSTAEALRTIAAPVIALMQAQAPYDSAFRVFLTEPVTYSGYVAYWTEENSEAVWREWAPNTGSYMNEGNPMNSNFKKDYYGSRYDPLFEIKQKYDPTESLYVLSGVGSDAWEYNPNTGQLCRK